jgi:aminomethyltransferase
VTEQLKRTPLFEQHLALGARMVPFGGWEMPVQYSGVMEEHRAVRNAAGLFDVSHMGEFLVEGPDALALIQRLSTNNVAKLAVGAAQYGMLCNDQGTIVDDILVYRLGEEQYWIVVNAGNIDKDWAWVNQVKEESGLRNLRLANISSQVAQIALQGPLAEAILTKLAPGYDWSSLPFYHAVQGIPVGAVKTLVVSRTGYTGEDGFELYCTAADAATLWNLLLEGGKAEGLLPAGLGARDTLRFEARLPLYGHEITDETNPYEAGLGIFVKLKKGVDFKGRAALEAIKEAGLTRKLVGLQMIDRGIPRQGYPIAKDGAEVGFITTGSFSPTLETNIGLGYVPVEIAEVGTEVDVVIRGKALKAQVVPTPFYQPRYKR